MSASRSASFCIDIPAERGWAGDAAIFPGYLHNRPVIQRRPHTTVGFAQSRSGKKMTTKDQEKRPVEQVKQDTQQLNGAIGRNVMAALGQGGDPYTLQVRRLWDGHYRVNVLVGTDAASVRVASSYFLVVDGEGNLLTSTPTIARQE
jgi:hypothetical protein